MIPLMPPPGTGSSLLQSGLPPILAQDAPTASESIGNIGAKLNSAIAGVFSSLPQILGACVILVLGIIAAYAVAFFVRSLLKKTSIDDTIASKITGRPPEDVPAAKWISDAFFWVIILFAVVAFLEAIDLTVVSEPLNNLLNTIFGYLPRIFSAGILLIVAWAIATVVKTIVSRGLETFNLDDRLAENTGVDPRESSVQIHETLGNALYWFIFLLFLPPILNALELNGLLAPVQGLIDQFLTAIPKIILAGLIFGAGWLLAKIARGIVTNVLAAAGVDNLGRRLGLGNATSPTNQLSLSGLAGTIVYVFILIPAAIAALNALDIDAISDPAISMLDQVLDFIPLILAAGVVVTVFYFIGRFISDLVTSLLSSAGFDGILETLGLPEISSPAPQSVVDPTQPNATQIQSTDSSKTPSEIVGLIVLVAIMLFGVVTATEILQLDQLTLIVRALMEIAGQVVIGVLIFGIGIYIANLAFRLIKSSNSGSSNTLAQAARIAILAFVGAMALGQMGVAPNIVNLAFGLLLGAVAIAIAIAFGLGGRDVAGKQLQEWLNELKR
ncbi:MAG: mechanosensitive ion channel [Cyanobacteria bacterium J06632_3]